MQGDMYIGGIYRKKCRCIGLKPLAKNGRERGRRRGHCIPCREISVYVVITCWSKCGVAHTLAKNT